MQANVAGSVEAMEWTMGALSRQSAGHLLRLGLLVLAALGLRAAAGLRTWRWRVQSRRTLAAMCDRQRGDIGLSRADVWREVRKPFWIA